MVPNMKEKPNIEEVLIPNLRVLMKVMKINNPLLATKSGISLRMIAYILSGQKKPTTKTIEALAKAFGVKVWQLLIPGLRPELIKSGKLDSLVKNYSQTSEKGREWIDHVAEQEAKYSNDKRVA